MSNQDKRKRKREAAGDDETDSRPHKTQVLETNPKPDDKSGERRQAKSERKKKSAVQAKQKGKDKSAKNVGLNGTAKVQDGIAAGQDFVSLNGAKSFKHKAAKTRSPRAIRKDARNAKALEENGGADGTEGKPGSGARFICFVGNLPYSVTTEQIATHFAKLSPTSIRLSTDKKTGKCKGFAFLEFDNFDKMKTCLKLYHHSIFDPENPEKSDNQDPTHNTDTSRGRKINVELTAGGGGAKSAGRRERIKVKNQKLNEERSRDWVKKKQEELKKGDHSRKNAGGPSMSGSNAEQVNDASDANRGDIHPSRLSRVQG